MKKIALLVGFLTISMLGSSALGAGEIPITEENLILLKGKWEGRRIFLVRNQTSNLPTELQLNEGLEGILICYDAGGGNLMDARHYEFKGAIKNGKLMIDNIGDYKKIELKLIKGDENDDKRLRLEGSILFSSSRSSLRMEGDLFLEKK